MHGRHILKKIGCLLSALILFSLISACSKSADLKDSHGQTIHLSDYKGKWVLINYWATWCKPCLKEMAALNALARNNVVVLGVSYDNLNSTEMNRIIKKQSITYPMLSRFPIRMFGLKEIPVLPITFVLNPEGKFVKTLKGPKTEAQFRQAIQNEKKN